MSPTSSKASRRRVVLRVRDLMAKHHIRSVASLHRMLQAAGVEISHPQLIRVIDNRAGKLNSSLLDGLLNLFDCPVSELFGDEPVEEGDATSPAEHVREPMFH